MRLGLRREWNHGRTAQGFVQFSRYPLFQLAGFAHRRDVGEVVRGGDDGKQEDHDADQSDARSEAAPIGKQQRERSPTQQANSRHNQPDEIKYKFHANNPGETVYSRRPIDVKRTPLRCQEHTVSFFLAVCATYRERNGKLGLGSAFEWAVFARHARSVWKQDNPQGTSRTMGAVSYFVCDFAKSAGLPCLSSKGLSRSRYSQQTPCPTCTRIGAKFF